MKRLHEWPLVVFSSLALAGAGLPAAWPLAALTGITEDFRPNAIWAVVLIAGAMTVSVAHLGRTARFPRAVRHTGRSALSNEVVAATLVLAAMLLLALGLVPGTAVPFLGVSAALACLFLVSLGLVYRLPARPSWTGLVAVTPLVSGLIFGSVWRAAAIGAWGARFIWPALVLILVDTAMVAARWPTLARTAGEAAHPPLFRKRHGLLLVRVLCLDAVTALLLLLGSVPAAVVTAGLGILLDRIAFYGLAVGRTLESEIERVEAVIAADGDA
jgi:DMSO reductase anchor subunit